MTFSYAYNLTQGTQPGGTYYIDDPQFDVNSLPDLNFNLLFDNNSDWSSPEVTLTHNAVASEANNLSWFDVTLSFILPAGAAFDIDQFAIIPDHVFNLFTPPSGETANFYGMRSFVDNFVLRPEFNVTEVITDETCPGSADGAVDITLNSTIPFSATIQDPYVWFGPGVNNVTTEDLTNLSAGTYDLFIDIHDCQETYTYTVDSPILEDITISSITDETCPTLADGSFTFNYPNVGVFSIQEIDNLGNIIGGVSGIQFYIGGSNISIDNLSYGIYQISFTDGVTGCAFTHPVTVGLDDPNCCIIIPEINASPESCPGTADGSIDISYGFPATYLWLGPNGFSASTQDISGINSGQYVLTITNTDTGCQETFNINVSLSSTTCCSNTGGTVTLPFNQIWNADDLILTNVYIPSGVTLTIENCEIQFGSDVHIFVDQGALLQVNNATLTNQEFCDELWGGVEIWGQNFVPQQIQTAQGRMNLESSSISYARMGSAVGRRNGTNQFIPNSGGGILWSQNSTFLNNERDIEFTEYYPWASDNDSRISLTKFFITPDYENYNGDFPEIRIKLNVSPGIYIRSCTFLNTFTDLLTAGTPWLNTPSHPLRLRAIDSDAGNFRVSGCSFTDFAYGIRSAAVTGGDGGLYPPQFTYIPNEIHDSEFNCFRGVHMLKPGRMRITNNIFRPLTTGNNIFNPNIFDEPTNLPIDFINNGVIFSTVFNGYGLYMNTAQSRWIIEDNLFNMTLADNVGCIIANNGDYNNILYYNQFIDNPRGANFLFQNRGTNWMDGLSFQCNLFENSELDVSINALQQNQLNGVAFFQGSPQFSAGNDMSNSSSAVQFDEIANMTDNFHIYFFNGFEIDPLEVFDVVPAQTDANPFCPSFKNASVLDLENDFELAGSDYLSAKNQWGAIVDGGDTESLTEEVIQTEFSEALELYYELMSKSPNLSDEVMLEAVEKEYDLPMVLLKQILQSNPQAAKSDKIQTKLDERLMPLPEYMREQINEGLEWVSLKEELEAEMAHHRAKYEQLYLHQQFRIWNDEEITDKEQALNDLSISYDLSSDPKHTFINELSTVNSPLEKAIFVEDQLSDFSEDAIFTSEMTDLIEVYELKAELEAGISTFGLEVENTLLNMASSSQTLAAAEAVKLLENYTGKLYLEISDLPNTPISTRASESVEESLKELEISMYPNPTSDMVIIELSQYPLTNQARYSILNIEGKLVQEGELKSHQDAVLDLSSLRTGSYRIMLIDQGDLIQESQIIKQ
ncbi:MAG: T9SS type A sorting domain-containing protein [Flavobacteriales bacterium]